MKIKDFLSLESVRNAMNLKQKLRLSFRFKELPDASLEQVCSHTDFSNQRKYLQLDDSQNDQCQQKGVDVQKTKKDGAQHDHLNDQVTTVDALVNPQSEVNNMSSKTVANNNVGIGVNSSSSSKNGVNSSSSSKNNQ